MTRPLPPSPLSVASRVVSTQSRAATIGVFHALKAEYSAALPSRFRRTRTNLGGSADAHYARWTQFYQLREYARDWDRNDPLVGQLVDRAVGNVLQGGLRIVPQTDNPALNAQLKSLWREWAEDPSACDATGQLAFPEIEALVLRHRFIDGDVFVLPLDNGTLQIAEGDLVDSAYDEHGRVIHGVELDGARRPVRYWFLKEPIDRRFSHASRYPSLDGYDKRPAYDEDGEPVVLHVFDRKRASQSRGVTAFHAIADYLGQIEDVNFATLLKQQIAACVALFINRIGDIKLGDRDTEAIATSNSETVEALTPGMVIRGRPGEQITAFSPAVPSNEYFEHMRFLLRVTGAQLGLPLELVLLDFSQGNFSSQRMAIEEARRGAERIQESLPRRFHRWIYRWKVRQWIESGRISPLDAANPTLYAHKWSGRGWAYIDPQRDAQADKLRLENMLVSPRDLATERGYDYDEIVAELTEDREKAIAAAQKVVERLTTKGVEVSWREVLGWATPTGLQGTTADSQPEPPAPAPKKEAEAEVTRAELRAELAPLFAAVAARPTPAVAPVAPVHIAEARIEHAAPDFAPVADALRTAGQDAAAAMRDAAASVAKAINDKVIPVDPPEPPIIVQPPQVVVQAHPGEVTINLPPRKIVVEGPDGTTTGYAE